MTTKNIETILLIEDDQQIVDLLQSSILELGYAVDVRQDGELGLATALEHSYALIIMDVGLPKLNGFEVCKRIRAQHLRTPILMLTARTEEIDKVLGLEIGADDYVVKPFSVRELHARITALLRRSRFSSPSGAQSSGNSPSEGILQFGPLHIDLEKMVVTLDGKEVELTALEFRLLQYLAVRPGAVVSRKKLIEEVWGYGIENYSSTITSHIRRLRTKIELDPNDPIFVKTAHGVGYRFAEAKDFLKKD